MPALDYAQRLRQARERSGKSIGEMAAILGISWEWYNHLEGDDEEIIDGLSLSQLMTLSQALGIDLVDFFSNGAPKPAENVSLETLAEKIKEYLATHNMTVPEFEELVRWDVAACLFDPNQFMKFDLCALMEVCKPLGVNWLAVLADLPPDV